MKLSAFLATLAGGNALAASLVFEELSGGVPHGWKHVGIPANDDRILLRIAMKSSQPGLLDQTLLDVSDPDSRNYGKHLKQHELKEMMKPSLKASSAVVNWLTESGVDSSDIRDAGEWINFRTTVAKANAMLSTTFAHYKHDAESTHRVRALSYSLPEELHDAVDMVQPTTRFGQIKAQRSWVLDTAIVGEANSGLNVTACNATITPACLRALYNVNGYKAPNKGSGFIGINNFLEEYPRYDDLATFEAEYAPYAIGKNFSFQSVNGGLLDQTSADDSVEANLDMQYVAAMGYDVPITAYSTAGRGPLIPDLDQPTLPGSNEPYLDFFTYLTGLPDHELPLTLTTSYGEDEQSVPAAYSIKVCQMIGQLGARGVSVLFSSGDTGPGSACQSNDGKNRTIYNPTFPGACPYVTSVGGTYRVQPERAIAFSSGGFSERFPRPAYQQLAVSAYLAQNGDKNAGLFNPFGRGFPDISAQSYRFHVIDKQREILVGGTSASAPTVAGIVSLLNSARVNAGLPPLGFLNPWLYAVGYKGLNDITVGGSRGCTGTDMYSGLPAPQVPYAGFNATVGWDPVTGLGTPDFQKLLALAVPGNKFGKGPGYGWSWDPRPFIQGGWPF